ncbi:MAG: hypothetical protein ABW215_08550 [Kibdelosporangium sp.]
MQVDEKKLAELFNDAVRDAPPATFGTGEIRTASRHATKRLRNGIVAGTAAAVVLLGGAAFSVVALTGGESLTTAASPEAANGEAGPNSGTMYGEGDARAPRAADQGQTLGNDRQETPKQGGSPGGEAGGSAGVGTPGGCGQADRELAAALAGELPAATKKIVSPVPFGCPPGSRAAAYKVTDGARSGTISVVLVPKGATTGFAPMGSDVPGTENFNSEARKSGGTLVVVSQPTPELAEPPFSDMGSRIATELGAKF